MPKYSLEEVLVLAQRGVGVEEEDALLLQVLADLVVDDLGLVLRRDAGDQALLLGLGDAEPVVGVLDVRGQVVPGGGLLLGRADEVLDVVEVDARQVGAPGRHRLLAEQAQALEAQVRASTRGSLLSAEMLRTTSSDRPRCAVAPAVSESDQPNCVAAEAVELGVRGLRDGRSSRTPPSGGGAVSPRVCAGRRSCRRRRRGRWSPVAGRGCRAGARRPRSRPRTARGTARRRARPGSGAGRAAPPRAGRPRPVGRDAAA